MADGQTRSAIEDTTMAFADGILYGAIFGNFYGTVEFSFKCGRIVLVRRTETVIPTSSERIDGGEAISKESRDGTHQRHRAFDQR